MNVIRITDKLELVDINLEDFVSTLDCVNEHRFMALGSNYYFIYDDGIISENSYNALASFLMSTSRGSYCSYGGNCVIVKTDTDSWDYDGTGVVGIEQEDYDKLLRIIHEHKRSTESA